MSDDVRRHDNRCQRLARLSSATTDVLALQPLSEPGENFVANGSGTLGNRIERQRTANQINHDTRPRGCRGQFGYIQGY